MFCNGGVFSVICHLLRNRAIYLINMRCGVCNAYIKCICLNNNMFLCLFIYGYFHALTIAAS